ncbi:MAG: hypothetical protein WAQ24_01295 [Candidatus Saccharimonadales bacterium]
MTTHYITQGIKNTKNYSNEETRVSHQSACSDAPHLTPLAGAELATKQKGKRQNYYIPQARTKVH